MKNIEDFLTNKEFVRWVKKSEPELDAYWSNWVKANPEVIDEFKIAKEIAAGLRFETVKSNQQTKDEILEEVLKGSPKENGVEYRNHYMIPQTKRNLWERLGQWQRIAAILTILISISYFLVEKNQLHSENEMIVEVRMIEKEVGMGEKLSLTLPDGSRIWLNSGSRVQFSEDFLGAERIVYLDGEAFFDVEKDPDRPFRVMTSGLTTTALGTSFNIRARLEDKVKISLVTGKVAVEHQDRRQEMILDPGQEVDYDLVTHIGKMRPFDTEKTLGWKDGLLVFDNASLEEVKEKLEEWYGVSIRIQNERNSRWRYSGSYRNQMLENVLNSISFTEEFEFEIKGKHVELKLR